MTAISDPVEPAAPVDAVATPHVAGARKLAVTVAGRIEADILASGLPVGSVFGSEGELRVRYGVSRAVLREAIRLVEHHEVATMRRGPSGGLIVREPDAGPLTAAMVIYLEHVGTSVDDLLAVRMLLEPLAARLAADRMNEGGIQSLRDALEAERSAGPELGGRDLLHSALGELSGNAALRLFIEVLVELTRRYAHTPQPPTPEESEAVKRRSGDAHRAIVDAIVAGDTGLAEQRTVRHLEAMRGWLLSTRQRPIGGRPRDEFDVSDRGGKLAEVVARRIMADISAGQARVGTVVGSESDLLKRLGVSRAVLREAVRLLEYHSVAWMRRGPGGGLVVAEPDATASIEAMAIYLDYQKVGPADLRVIRDVIEIGALELVMQRHDDPVVAERLHAAARTEGLAPSEALDERAHHVHTEIAALSGNPLLVLFLRILTTVWARHLDSVDDTLPESWETADLVTSIHQRIIEAVLAGDLPLARHRLRRHLEALTSWWH